MTLSLTDLFEKQGDSVFRNKVAAACWRHAKTLLTKASPTTGELKLAFKLLSESVSGETIKKFAIGAAVLIDDATVDDAAIEAAIVAVADKLVALEI